MATFSEMRFNYHSSVNGKKWSELTPQEICDQLRTICGKYADGVVFDGGNIIADYNHNSGNATYYGTIPQGTTFTMPKRDYGRTFYQELKTKLDRMDTLPNIIEELELEMEPLFKQYAHLFIHRAYVLGIQIGLKAQSEYSNESNDSNE